MRDITRSGITGRLALAFVLFVFSVIGIQGQIAPSSQKPADAPAAGAAPQEAKDAVKDTPKAQESAPATADTQAPAAPGAERTPKPPTEADATKPQTTGGKASPQIHAVASGKKGKRGKADGAGSGIVSGTGVDTHTYVIGPEDLLYVNVYHQPDVSGNVAVRPDGFISMRFVGEIKAAGLTTSDLSDQISDRLTKYFNRPEVNIQVAAIRSKKIYLSGEIRKPGPVLLTGPMTVLDAITDAGGPAEFAKKNKIYVLRGSQRLPFNYNEVVKGQHLEQNILLQNGDHIHIP